MPAEAASATALATLLGRFARAVAARDTAGFTALFTPDGRYHDGFFGVHEGRDAIAAMLERFFVGGEAFFWQFRDVLASDGLGYARYVFSYRSREPESAGQLVVFDGIAQLRLRNGLIVEYDEAFDRGIAFTQLGYETARIGKLLGRYGAPVAAALAQATQRATERAEAVSRLRQVEQDASLAAATHHRLHRALAAKLVAAAPKGSRLGELEAYLPDCTRTLCIPKLDPALVAAEARYGLLETKRDSVYLPAFYQRCLVATLERERLALRRARRGAGEDEIALAELAERLSRAAG